MLYTEKICIVLLCSAFADPVTYCFGFYCIIYTSNTNTLLTFGAGKGSEISNMLSSFCSACQVEQIIT